MPASGRSSVPLSRGGPRTVEQGPTQYLPSQHSEHQYEGLLSGLGVSSKEPVVSKRSNSLAKLHMATHFAVGCKKWDDPGGRGLSTNQAAFQDPEVVYATRDCPDKNASIVELRQREHIPTVHYRTEQKERFDHPGYQPLDEPFPLGLSKVHFGDDQPELCTSTASAHHRAPDDEARRAAEFRRAGCGTLVPTSIWNKPPRVNPITAGPRSIDNHDYGMDAGMRFERVSANRSNIIMEHNIRNPIMGHHIPVESYRTPHAKTSGDIVADANNKVPALRSLGALRPHQD